MLRSMHNGTDLSRQHGALPKEGRFLLGTTKCAHDTTMHTPEYCNRLPPQVDWPMCACKHRGAGQAIQHIHLPCQQHVPRTPCQEHSGCYHLVWRMSAASWYHRLPHHTPSLPRSNPQLHNTPPAHKQAANTAATTRTLNPAGLKAQQDACQWKGQLSGPCSGHRYQRSGRSPTLCWMGSLTAELHVRWSNQYPISHGPDPSSSRCGG